MSVIDLDELTSVAAKMVARDLEADKPVVVTDKGKAVGVVTPASQQNNVSSPEQSSPAVDEFDSDILLEAGYNPRGILAEKAELQENEIDARS